MITISVCFAISSHKHRSSKYFCVNHDDVEEVRIDKDYNDDCSFGGFPTEKKYVVDCFGAREAEMVQYDSEDDELYFITDNDCSSSDGKTGWDGKDSKYQDSNIDSFGSLNPNRHFYSYEIKALVKAIMNKYNPDNPFSDKLMRLITSKGIDYRTFYKRANISRQTWSKIRNDPTHRPDKKTIISFAFILELTLDETQELLSSVGLTLSECMVSDFIVMYFLKNKIYNISALNEALYDLKQETL